MCGEESRGHRLDLGKSYTTAFFQLEFGVSELLIIRSPKDCLRIISEWKAPFFLPFLPVFPLRK